MQIYANQLENDAWIAISFLPKIRNHECDNNKK